MKINKQSVIDLVKGRSDLAIFMWHWLDKFDEAEKGLSKHLYLDSSAIDDEEGIIEINEENGTVEFEYTHEGYFGQCRDLETYRMSISLDFFDDPQGFIDKKAQEYRDYKEKKEQERKQRAKKRKKNKKVKEKKMKQQQIEDEKRLLKELIQKHGIPAEERS